MTLPRYSILVPTFNESEIILDTLRDILGTIGTEKGLQTEIIIVDDGTDNLPVKIQDNLHNFRCFDLKVLRNNPPKGKGNSLAAGFEVAKGKIVGFLDADLSTPSKYIPIAISALENEDIDLFIGSRRGPESLVTREQFFLKDFLGNCLGILARKFLFAGMRNFEDTQCGFKFYKNEVAKVLYKDLLAGDGLNDLEVLIRANLLKYSVKEFGVVWTDVRESKRTLRRILMGEIAAIGKIIFRYRLSHFNLNKFQSRNVLTRDRLTK